MVYFSLFAMKVFNVRSLNGFATPIHSQLSLEVKSLLSGFVQSNLPHLQMCALLTHSVSICSKHGYLNFTEGVRSLQEENLTVFLSVITFPRNYGSKKGLGLSIGQSLGSATE